MRVVALGRKNFLFVGDLGGDGIVFGSDPAREVAETELEARILLDAMASLERTGDPE